MLKIYGRANSINVRKVLWIADELGIAYSREDWGRGFRATSDPDFERVNPFAVVPVIDDDGFVLRESNTIVRYLTSKQRRTDLYPLGLQERATVEAWMDWGSTDLYLGVRPVFLGLTVKMQPFADDKAGTERAIAEWTRQMKLLDVHLRAAGPYIAGKDFTIADIPAGLTVNRWYSIDFKKPDLPGVAAYYERLSQRRAYKLHGRNGTP